VPLTSVFPVILLPLISPLGKTWTVAVAVDSVSTVIVTGASNIGIEPASLTVIIREVLALLGLSESISRFVLLVNRVTVVPVI